MKCKQCNKEMDGKRVRNEEDIRIMHQIWTCECGYSESIKLEGTWW